MISELSFWMGGGLESCCVGRVYGADYHLVASSWHSTLFHEEDAWSNNPQVFIYLFILL